MLVTLSLALQNAASLAMWFFHLAHEAFHLSNGEMFQPLEDAQWLSEGSADYFALLLAREAGVLDQGQVEQRLLDAANRCIQKLGSMSLAAAGKAGKYDVFYSCGNVISFAADRAIQRRSQGQGHIGTLFHRIFTGALESRHYSTTDFLRELEFLRRVRNARDDRADDRLWPRSRTGAIDRGASGPFRTRGGGKRVRTATKAPRVRGCNRCIMQHPE